MVPKPTKFQSVLLVLILLFVVFVSVPLLANSGILPSIQLNQSADIVDPTTKFKSISSVQEVAYSGMWKSEKTYYTIYSRNLTSCNTYTLTGELKLVDKNNGLQKGTKAYTFNTNEPTAVTCTVEQDVLNNNKNKEVLILILDYNKSNGEYTVVDSVNEIES